MSPIAPSPSSQIDQALTVIHQTLQSAVAGAYLFGSAVTGGLKPDSDLDILILTQAPMSPEARLNLLDGLRQVSGNPANDHSLRPLEVTVIVLADLKPWHYPPAADVVYGEWLREYVEAGNIPQPTADPDLTLVLATALRRHLVLSGPPLEQYLDEIPATDIRRAIIDSLPALIAGQTGDERNVMLTLARMWYTLATGNIVPKDVAAHWALPQLPAPHRPILTAALDAYTGDYKVAHATFDSLLGAASAIHSEPDWLGRQHEVNALVSCMRRQIETLAGSLTAPEQEDLCKDI